MFHLSDGDQYDVGKVESPFIRCVMGCVVVVSNFIKPVHGGLSLTDNCLIAADAPILTILNPLKFSVFLPAVKR